MRSSGAADPELLEALSRQPLLAALPAHDRELLAGLGSLVVSPAGTRLTEEGTPVSSVWVVLAGRLNVEIGEGASRTSLAVLTEGALLGEASYLTGRPATASVTALAECRLVEIAQARLRAACDEHPEFGLRLERLLVGIFTERLSRTLAAGTDVELPAVDAASLTSLRDLRPQPLEEEATLRYARFGKRDPFLWRWCLRALELTTLPCVPEDGRLDGRATKFLAAVTVVIVDDVADLGSSPEELSAALALLGDEPDGPVPSDEALRGELGWLWSALGERCTRLPRYETLADVLAFDWRMVFTANRHARLARDVPALVNPTESMEYAPHGIAMMVFGTIDLMSSPELAPADLPATRELVHAGQALCELANMVATWRREIPDRDFGSRIFALGMTRGAFTSDELQALSTAEIVERIEAARLEEALIDEWRSQRARAAAAAERIGSYDASPLLGGYDAVFGMTLAARGSI